MFGSKGQAEAGESAEKARVQAGRGRWAAALEAAFRETADPGSYVPREGTEWVLRELQTAVTASRRPVALAADPGMGKSLLLHVLEERLEGSLDCVFLPYGSLSMRDLCAWSLGRMGEAPSADPVSSLLTLARSRADQGRALVLLIDDSSGLPLDVARQLSWLWSEADGALRLVLTSPADARGEEVFAAFGSDLYALRFRQPMGFGETRDFVRRRLSQAGVPRVSQNRFDRACMEWIYQRSGGVPRLVQRLGQSILVDQPADVTPSWQHNEAPPVHDIDESSAPDREEPL